MTVSADVNDVNDVNDGKTVEVPQENGNEVDNQRNVLNGHIDALVDGMADFGVEFVLAKIAALKNRDRPDDDKV